MGWDVRDPHFDLSDGQIEHLRRKLGDEHAKRLLEERAANLRRDIRNVGGSAMAVQHTVSYWCEHKNHAFSSKDPLAKTITVSADTAYDDDKSFTVCGPCRQEMGGPFGLTKPPALESGDSGAAANPVGLS